MTEADVEVAYTNKNYYVVVLDAPIIDSTGEMPPMSYGLYNRRTEVMESYSTFFPAAVQTVVGLSEKIEELMPEEENNIVTFTPDIILN